MSTPRSRWSRRPASPASLDVGAAFDAAVAARPRKTCIFPGSPAFQADLLRPLPHEHEVDGVKYVLDFEGDFVAGYRLA